MPRLPNPVQIQLDANRFLQLGIVMMHRVCIRPDLGLTDMSSLSTAMEMASEIMSGTSPEASCK